MITGELIMSFKPTLQEKIEKTDFRLKEMRIFWDRIDREMAELAEKWEIDLNTLDQEEENPESDTPEEEAERAEFFAYVHRELDRVNDLKKAEEARSSLTTIQRHWIPVR